MKRTLLIIASALTVFGMSSAFVTLNSGGKAGQTGSPGEGNCGACHSGGTSLVSGATITAIPAFTNNTYVPGQTYTMNMIIGAVGFSNFGFACEILNSSNASTGTMQNAGTNVQLVTGNGRMNATHTAPKSGTGLTTFSFEWVAPSSGAVNIYLAGNCVNNNGGTSGDLPLTASLSLTTPSTTGISENVMEISGFGFYPNPAKEQINFNYSLNEAGNVTIDLVSINGQLISHLINEKQAAGLQKKTVYLPTNLASGVYFIKTSHNNKQVSQKLISIQ